MNCVSSEYIADLKQEVVELCSKSRTNKSEPLQESPTLASRMTRTDKDHRSRFKATDDIQ